MRAIMELADSISEEIADARSYASRSEIYKETDQRLAELYGAIAKQELQHADQLHEHVTRLITAKQNEGATVPKGMLDVWSWTHKKLVEDRAEVVAMLTTQK